MSTMQVEGFDDAKKRGAQQRAKLPPNTGSDHAVIPANFGKQGVTYLLIQTKKLLSKTFRPGFIPLEKYEDNKALVQVNSEINMETIKNVKKGSIKVLLKILFE